MNEENTWIYQGKPFQLPEDHEWYGFVYLITNKHDGRKYCGKKFFWSRTTRVKNKKRKKVLIESDWKTYFGSNNQLKEDVANIGADVFIREILHLCRSKSECAYLEAKEQFDREVLLSKEYYNSWISLKITKKHLQKYAEKKQEQIQID